MEIQVAFYIDGECFRAPSVPMFQVPRIGEEIHWKMFFAKDNSRVFIVANVRWRKSSVEIYCNSFPATDEQKARQD